jgi:phospholipid/cholesterol/gamma-HCH transport system substrate-binding protein
MTDEQRQTQGPSEQELAAAVPKDGSVRLVLIGAFVIMGIISTIAVLYLTTDPATLRGRYMLVTEMDDAGGVRAGDPVQMRGVNIGRVHGFEMTDDGRVTITLEIEGEWQVPEGSRAELAEAGLFGGRTVAVRPSDAARYLEPYDTIPGADVGGGMMETASRVGEEAEVLLGRLEMLLDTGTVRAVQGSTREVEALTRSLRESVQAQRDEVESLIASLGRTAAELEGAATAAGPDVAAAAARVDALLGELEGTAGRLDRVMDAMDTVLGRMARGEGTLGKLSSDDRLYESLTAAATSLDSLLVDIRANPKRYVTVEIF